MAHTASEMRDFLAKAHDASMKQLPLVRFNADGNNQLMAVSLYCSLIEYAGTLLTLSDHDRRTGFSSVFRSFLEGYVDFVNLLASDDFYFRKEASYHSEWKKVLNECKPGNLYLKGIAESSDLVAVSKGHDEAIKDLAARGFAPVSVFDSFKMAGMEEEYHSLYRFECAEAHNDFRALLKRNVTIGKDGKRTVEVYLQAPPHYYLARLDTVASLLLDASEKIHNKVGSKVEDAFKPFRAELEELRK